MISDKTKNKVIEHLQKSLGNISLACKKCRISRTTFYEWMKNDAEFKQQVDEIQDIAADFVESALYRRIEKGDTSAIIFALKTKYRGRGWTEKQEVAVDVTSGGQPIRYCDIMPKRKQDGTDSQAE